MKRLVLTLTGIGTLLALAAGPALAFQCPKLVSQINAESEKVAKDALGSLGVKM
jgi:hypothetical protein